MPKSYIHKCNFGYIVGKIKGEAYWIEEFVVYARYRGKGYARRLAEFLPRSCYLCACPLWNKKGKKFLNTEQLIIFYKSLGFLHSVNKYGHNIMYRNMEKPCPDKSELL